MKRTPAALLVLAFILAACAAPSPTHTTDTAEQNTLWLEPGELGYEEQAKWGLPLPEGFGVVVLPPELFFANCDALNGEPCAASVSGITELEHARVILRDDLSPADFHHTLLHEMGHLLRGEGGHIEDPQACPEGAAGEHVLCAWGSGAVQWPSAVDMAFVLHAAGAEL